VLGARGDRLQARGTESVHRHRRGVNRNAGAQAGDAGDIQSLFRLRHRTAHDDVIHVAWIDAGRTAQGSADDGGGHFVWPDRFE
jgi:hypothetical protein